MEQPQLERIEDDQTLDQETDYETRELVARERALAAQGKMPKINALTREQYYARPRPQRNLRAGTAGVNVEPEFDPYDRGSDTDDPGVKPAQQYRPSPAVSNDIVNEGHGFVVWKSDTNPDLPDATSLRCVFCGKQLIPEDDSQVCEFESPTYLVPMRVAERLPGGRVLLALDLSREPIPDPDVCECNGCRQRRMGRRPPGNQPIQCGSGDCQRAMDRKHQADKRERDKLRARLQAVEIIRQDPDLPDKDIAARLGIRLVRVREARRELVSPIP